MAVEYFEIDSDLLRKDTSDLKQYLQLLKKTYEELLDKMSVLSGMWEGPAKDAFQSQFYSECTELQEICKQLEETITSMENAVTQYDACDGRVRSVINAIKV